MQSCQTLFFIQPFIPPVPQPSSPQREKKTENVKDEEIFMFDEEFDADDGQSIPDEGTAGKGCANIKIEDKDLKLTKNIAEVLQKEVNKLFELLQGKTQSYEIGELGIGHVSLYNGKSGAGAPIAEKIKLAVAAGKIVLAALKVKKDENQLILHFKIAQSAAPNIQNIDQMRNVIALNIAYAKAHKDSRFGIGSFKAIWEKEKLS